MTELDKMLASASPEQLANDPIMRAAFIVGLMASDIFVPVAGVIIVDALFMRRKDYHIDTLTDNRAFNWAGLTAWALGAGFALMISHGLLQSPTGITSIDAIILAALSYTILAWASRKRTAI